MNSGFKGPSFPSWCSSSLVIEVWRQPGGSHRALVWFGLIAVCDLSGLARQAILFCVAIGFLTVACLPERGGISWSAILMMCPVVFVATFPLWPLNWRELLYNVVATSGGVDELGALNMTWPVAIAYVCVILAQGIRLSRS